MIGDYMDELTHDATNDVSLQSIVGTAGTAIVGGKVKDGGAAGDWGAGCEMQPVVRIGTAVAGASGGVQFDIVTADNALLTSNPVVLSTRTIATASLTANSLHRLPQLAPGTRKRHLGVKVTPLTSDSTAGTAMVGLQPCGSTPQNRVNNI
jgi:hypothetical protein